MEDIHTGGRGLEIAEFLCSIFTGLSFIAIAVRDLMVKRTTFDFYVCPKCHYTIFVEEDSSTVKGTKLNGYIEYKKRLKNVSQLISEIKKANDF
jgi:hypothetical protein